MAAMKYILSIALILSSNALHAGGGGGGGILLRSVESLDQQILTAGNGGGTLSDSIKTVLTSDDEIQIGGTGGGGVLDKTPEIVFHLGQENGTLTFAYGHWFNNKWKIEKVRLPIHDLNEKEISALQASETLRSWIYLK